MVVRSGMVEWDRVTSGGRVMEGKLRNRLARVRLGLVLGCGVWVYLCHLIACWMVLDKAVGTYSI